MPITEQQREQRRKFLGSSDAAAVVGLDPFRSPLDIFYDKTGQIVPTSGVADNEAIRLGNILEEPVLRWFGAEKNLKLILNDDVDRNRRLHANGIMAANFDAFVDGDPRQAVEAKTHGLVSLYIDEQWGEVETGEVPERVGLQCQHQMAVVPSVETVWVPVLLGGVGLRYYRVDRNAELIADLETIEVKFWRDHVLAGIAPEGEPASLDTYKKLRRVPEKIVDVADEIVAAWLAAKEALKQAEIIKDENTSFLLQALGDAEAARCGLGELTYFLNKGRKAYSVEAKDPYRELRYKKPKGAKS